jgi:drug/metabolite transporter (DMT)-like permease
MTKNSHLCELQLLFGSVFYGVSVVLARFAMEIGIGPYTFNALQHIVAFSILAICRRHIHKVTNTPCMEMVVNSHTLSKLLYWACICGAVNFAACTLCQVGLVTVEAGKSSFLTSLYVVITPIMQCAQPGGYSKISSITWFAIIVSLFGSYLLAGDSTEINFIKFSYGELLTLFGAVLYALYIIIVEHCSKFVNCTDLAIASVGITTAFCTISSLIFEPHMLFTANSDLSLSSMGVVFIVGLLEGFAFLLQTLGQLHTSSAKAAIIMSSDAIITCVIAYLFLNESLSLMEYYGCLGNYIIFTYRLSLN